MQMKTFGPAIIVVLAGLVIAWQFVNPAPPRTITIATGKPDGAYYLFATRYRERLAGLGITLDIRESAGSVENIDLLQSPDAPVDLAFVQGGTGDRSSAAALRSLGSLYFEPLWVFYRGPKTDRLTDRLTDLADMRTAIGEPGSGTRRITLTLLADNFIDAGADTILPLGGEAAAGALLDGSIDAAFFVASPEAPVVQRLLHRPDIRLLSFARAAAYVQTHHYLSAVTLPEGIIDLQANIPARDTTLLAPTANLVARSDFHPALISLLLQIVSDMHRQGSLFSQPGEFPNANHLEYPLDKTAERFYRHGPPLLQRYLPFWTADLVDRMKVMLVPLLTLLFPLIKIMPPVYRWRVRKKIYRWYRLLRKLETGDSAALDGKRRDELLRQLQSIDDDVRKLHVPLSYSDELYNLRLHIDMVRKKLLAAARP
ncbi:MAG: TAXI family TRAP transporter solute-binding subunit [Gammaproteobacteria bacterium]